MPALGYLVFFVITGYFFPEVSSNSSATSDKWVWPHSSNAAELPINSSSTKENAEVRKTQRTHNIRGVFPEITVKVYDPYPSDTRIFHSVKVHVQPPSPEQLTLLSPSARNKLIAPKGPKIEPDDNFISASSNLMQYDDFPVGMKNRQNIPRTPDNGNRLSDNSEPPQSVSVNVNDQSDQRIRKKSGNPKKNRKGKKRIGNSVKGYFYNGRKTNKSPKKSLSPLGIKSTSLTFHSPRRVYVPVWRKGKSDIDNSTSSTYGRYCLQCPSNLTLYVGENKSTAIVPLVSLSICKSLARRKGKLNLAVISGPPPGAPLVAGEYPTHLIAWKLGGKVFSCQYTVIVKVEYCPEIRVKDGLRVTCDNENIVGSECSFECTTPGEVVGGVVRTTKCIKSSENGPAEWDHLVHPAPFCEKKAAPEHKAVTDSVKPCDALATPANGRLICNSLPRDGLYTSGTICQFFCFPGFDSRANDTLFVCDKGTWDPEIELYCTASSCPQLIAPRNGVIKCQSPNGQVLPSNNGFSQGTKCSYECETGFVVPSSQAKLKHIECVEMEWNFTASPDCKQKIVPKPGPNECNNRTLFVARGTSVPMSIPKFYSEDESGNKRKVNVTCSHGLRKLVPGTHINRCTAHDKELDTYGHCSYTVEVKAKSCPVPKGIRNSKRKCSLFGKPITNGYFPPDTICKISCEDGYMFSEKMSYVFSRCLANSRWNRSWRLSCKKAKTSCPAVDAIPNGELSCKAQAGGKDHSVSSVCEYVCNEGYVVPSSQIPRASRRCLPSGKWNTTKIPTCELAIPPKPENGSCKDFEILTDDLSSIKFHTRFEFGNGSIVDSNCSPTTIESYGLTHMICAVYDEELRLHNVCNFSINATRPSNSTPDDTPTDPPVFKGEEDQLPILTGCEDQIANSTEFSFPQFKSISNETLNASCSPVDFDNIAPQTVYCIATDPHTNLTSNCSFTVTIKANDDVSDTAESTDGAEATTLSTSTDDQEDSPQVVEPGCVDQFTESGFNFNVSLPEFVTSRNTSAEVVCSPVDPEIYEVQTVSCEAVDPETNASSSCEFKVTVANSNLRSHDVMEDITEALTREIYASLSQTLDCETLEAPSNGHINCSSPDECFVECEDGYGFSSSYPTLSEGHLSCNKSNGLWNFQGEIEKMPGCLRELPSTSVEVWLGFSASVDNCSSLDETEENLIKQKLLELNNETCNLIDCDATLVLNCSSDEDDDEENNSTVVVVTWNLKASYNPKDYRFNKKVPVAETQLESVLEDTKQAVQSEDSDFSTYLRGIGLQVMQNTFGRGHMTLVCDERGFFVEPETDQCIECAVGHMEVKGSCVPCPPQQYQDKSGQIECNPCPTALTSDEVPAGC